MVDYEDDGREHLEVWFSSSRPLADKYFSAVEMGVLGTVCGPKDRTGPVDGMDRGDISVLLLDCEFGRPSFRVIYHKGVGRLICPTGVVRVGQKSRA